MNTMFDVLAAIGKIAKDYVYQIEDGCLQNRVHEPHSRGKNWIASVVPNRASPGGLDREFWRHGSGSWYKMSDRLDVGEVIEMGGDYVSGRGNKTRDRHYILVVRCEADYIVGAFIGTTAPSTRSVAEKRAKYIAEPASAVVS